MTTAPERDPNFDNVDPLGDTYREAITNPRRVARALADHRTALLVIDVQYLDAAPDHGVFATEQAGVSEAAKAYYFDRLRKDVLPNIRLLQDAFRSRGMEVIHTRICSLTQDGRDRSEGHKRLHLHAAPGSKEAEFLPEVAPMGDEIVLNKTASGVFNATNIEYILRNMGITALFVVGVYTNECVETSARDACDRGFLVTVIDDACATVTPDLHDASLRTMKDRYARVINTEDALQELIEEVHI